MSQPGKSRSSIGAAILFAGLILGVALILSPGNNQEAQTIAWMTVLLGYAATQPGGSCCFRRSRTG